MFADMMRWGTESGQKLPSDDRYFWGHHPMMGFMGNNAGAFWVFGILIPCRVAGVFEWQA